MRADSPQRALPVAGKAPIPVMLQGRACGAQRPLQTEGKVTHVMSPICQNTEPSRSPMTVEEKYRTPAAECDTGGATAVLQ